MVLFILRLDEGQASCVRPMTSGTTYFINGAVECSIIKYKNSIIRKIKIYLAC